MHSSNKNDEKSATEETKADFHGGAVIDKNGKEVPITEEMVQRACKVLNSSKKDLPR